MNNPQSDPISERLSPADESGTPPISLAKRITNWTNNFLATSVVIVVALACGTQLVSLWAETDTMENSQPPVVLAAWPTMESCALEFGSRPYQLSRANISGDRSETIRFLIDRCKRAMDRTPNPVGGIGTAESKMIASSASLKPIESKPGKWRLFQVDDPSGESLPMVIGIRDDCPGTATSRMVVWGIGMVEGKGKWTVYVCEATQKTESMAGEKSFFDIPPGTKRTLSISDHNGGGLIGFKGGIEKDVKQYFGRQAKSNDWAKIQDWKNIRTSDHAIFEETGRHTRQINIQLTLDSNQQLRGLIMIQPTRHNSTYRNLTE